MPTSILAQYFGQNKVRYETFEFKTLTTEHFDIYYYDEAAATVRDLGRMAERWYTRLSSVLDYNLSRRQPLIFYATHPAFRGTTVIPGEIGESTGGVTEGIRNRVVLPLAGPLKETDHVLGHELVHAFQYDISRRSEGGLEALPLWFVEGMAEYLSVGAVDAQTAMWMRDAVNRDKVPDIKDLDDPDYFPYRYGQAFWAYIGGKYGDDVIPRILRIAIDRGVETAFDQVLQLDEKMLSVEWREALQREYQPILAASTPPEDVGRLIVEAERNGNEVNIAPALSPDGSRMVFLSQRDLFSLDLYLADTRTGQIETRITRSAIDPHTDSLQFVNSSGEWSRDSRKFAYASIRNGRPALSIYDVERKNVEKEIRFPMLGEINSVTWSPDGQSIALSAVVGGVTDLFLVNVQTEMLRRLTDDAFADLQPAWSPDGSRIVFVTDRFTTQLEPLSYGDYRLGTLDPTNARIERVAAFNDGKHLNPQWSPDGASIYFISDRDGISNVYRLQRSNGALFQLTNLRTGVSGITALSPALSVASKGDRAVFSVFSNGMYSLKSLDEPPQLAGRPAGAARTPDAAVLPPRTATATEVSTLLRDPNRGLGNGRNFTSGTYNPKLSLDYIAPPSVAVGVSNFGSLVGGGTTLGFSDLLGQHNVFATFQSAFTTDGKFANNLSAIGGYLNERGRWSWGFSGGQVPFTSAELSRSLESVEGRAAVVDRTLQFWQINREMLAYAAYPFNRAQRLEFSGGYRRISFDAQEIVDIYDRNTGQLLGTGSQDIQQPGALNLGTGAAALVYDTSIFGGTSPVTGRRYRFEAGGTTGALRYTSLLGDFRQYYQIARPLSLAGRILATGRFGTGGEDSRLQDLFVGSESLVRGYDPGSFSASECGPELDQTGACPAFDRLVGSRMAVANAEVRVPLLGALGAIRTPGVPPVEAALFYDAGVAWTSALQANFLGGPRRPVTSYGSSLRVNILGFAIGQISLVHPNQRPVKGWHWEFSLLPGF